MLAIVLGLATAAVVFAAEKGIDNYVCARKAAAHRYDADEFEDDDDLFCEETTPPPQRYQGRVCPELFGRIQKVQDERLAESIRQGQELEELQKPDIEKSEETYVDIPEDVIDHVFKDVKPQDEPAEKPQEESTEEEKPVEETPAPERDSKGRFVKKQ